MFAAKFSLKRVSTARLHHFSPISTFKQGRFQRAEVAKPRTTSEFIDDEPLPFDQIPGPRGNKFATAVQFYRQSDGFTKIFKLTDKLFNDYGPIFKQYVTDEYPVVHVMEPTDFETVFRSEGKYPFRPAVDAHVKHKKRRGQFLGLENL